MSDVAVIHPATGEVLDVATTATDALAELVDSIKNLERELRSTKAMVADEIHRRMDDEASWTVHAGEFTVTGESPTLVEYDAEALASTLYKLSSAGQISPRARGEALEMVTTYKVRIRGVNQLLKLGGDVADAIKTCAKPIERPRRLTVKRRTP